MGTSLTCEPLISAGAWLALGSVALALLVWYAWRRPWGVSRIYWSVVILFMGLSEALLLILLLNPTWLEQIPPPQGKPRLTIVLDDSASMAADDLPDGGVRYQAAAAIAQATAQKLADQFEVQVTAFSQSVVPVDAAGLKEHQPTGPMTDLAQAIASNVEPNRPAGQALLLLSDGNHNAGGGTSRVLSAVALARSVDAPIFTKTFGSDAEIHDLALRLLAPQQLSFVGQTVPVSAFVRRRGRAPESVTVVLEHDGQEISRQQVFVTGETETEVKFEVQQDQRGVYRYEIHVEPFAGEVTQVNNYALFLLRVVDEPIRVLLVEGKPYWDSKFLARKLSADPSIELVTIVRVSDNRFLERRFKRQPPTAENPETKTSNPAERAEIPVTEEWRVLPQGDVLNDAKVLSNYQVVVLGRDAEPFLAGAAVENLRNWVAGDSGALVCYRGQPVGAASEALQKLLPLQWEPAAESRFRMALTDRGRDLRWFNSAASGSATEVLPHLPALATSAKAQHPKPLATVLATVAGQAGEEIPIVTYQPYGGGRVVVVEGSGMWRWAFLPPNYADHDQTYGALWQGLLRWLVSGAGLLPGQDMALRSDQVTFGTDETATATLLVRREVAHGPLPAIELTGGELSGVQSINPVATGEGVGVYRVTFGKLPEGRYQAQIAGQSADKPGASMLFDVRQLMEEQLDLKARPDLMARIAASTGGEVITGDSADEIARTFTEHLERGRPERVRRITAWDRWWVLVGAFLIWTTTWVLRRNAGLV